jgi:small subunit ribosomal protein S17
MARTLVGTVSSDKVDKTIVIVVAERKTHPLYKKQYTVNTKCMAHDENNEAKVGDRVVIKESRPISARKRFTLQNIVEKADVTFQEADATADVPEEPKVESPKPKASSAKPLAKATEESK